MTQTVSLGRLFDIRVGVHASWLVIYAIATWSIASMLTPTSWWFRSAIGAGCALLLFASVVAHEFAHALVARRFGVRTSGITLFIFGGVATIEREPPSPRAEVAIALAGPAASLIIAAFSWAAFHLVGRLPSTGVSDVVGLVFEYVMVANGMLGIFNLIPAFPMDGGRVVRALLWRVGGDQRRATVTAAVIGFIFASVLTTAGLLVIVFKHEWVYSWNIVLGMFLIRSTWSSYDHAAHSPREATPVAGTLQASA